MNGYTQNSLLHEEDFAEPSGISVQKFDAFPKTKPTYLTRTKTGNAWTLALIVVSSLLIFAETRRWFAGTINHAFTIEKGVSRTMQMNIDVVVKMQCEDLHVNVQDASGDRIMAGELLKKDPTLWAPWIRKHDAHKLSGTYSDEVYGSKDEDVHDYIHAARGGSKRFPKTPRLRGNADSCRIYGSIEENKVHGDFHITARGHGYFEFGMHLDHSLFNFTHHINELSFGPYYPRLVNPLDNTIAGTEQHFQKFQYYCNIVPTIYTTDVHRLKLAPKSKEGVAPLTDIDPYAHGSHGSHVWTNQYSVTEQSHAVTENHIPGIFVKYDIEPLLLVVNEERGGLLALIVRLVNVISGVLVAGTWLLQLTDWASDNYGKRGGRDGLGFLGRREESKFV